MYKLSAQSHRRSFRIKFFVGIRDGPLMFAVMYFTILIFTGHPPYQQGPVTSLKEGATPPGTDEDQRKRTQQLVNSQMIGKWDHSVGPSHDASLDVNGIIGTPNGQSGGVTVWLYVVSSWAASCCTAGAIYDASLEL